MLSSFYTLGLIIAVASLTTAKFAGQKHHKVRHKHNSFGLRDNHVNEIREAFDEYRNSLPSANKLKKYPKIENVELNDDYDDIIDNHLKPSSWESPKAAKISQTSQNSRSFYQPVKQYVTVIPTLPSEYFLRNKRVHIPKTSTTTTTTTMKSIDNYDDEYEDEDNDTANRRLNDDAHAGSLRVNRDVSFIKGQVRLHILLSDLCIPLLTPFSFRDSVN